MDYETKILLNRLVDEVEKLNSPDWCVIGITVVNALIMAWIGWRQYKLQQRQTKIQEHEVYKNLYSLIKSIHNLGGSIIYTAFFVLKDSKIDEFDIRHLQNKRKALDDLSLKLSEFEIDLGLKTNIRKIEYANYEFFLSVASGLIIDLTLLLKNASIHPLNVDKNLTFNENEMIGLILAKTEESERESLKKRFDNYTKLKNRIENYKILESLKKHCVL